MMKKVYICSPLGGNVEKNLEQVKHYTKYALKCGTAPVVPHFYALCLDDNDPNGRSALQQVSICSGSAMRCGSSVTALLRA